METIASKVYFDLGAGWVQNNDVLLKPPLTWEYGIRGDSPTDLLASTGIAAFSLDNSHSNGAGTPGLYSPDHTALLAGFGEGTKCKIELPGTDWLQSYFDATGAFDSITPAWDGEVGTITLFDATVDADGDMNDTFAARHDGPVGIEFSLDDNNPMYGSINADAINQTSGVVTFWFNKNNLSLNNGGYFWIFRANDGAAAINWSSFVWNDAGTFKIDMRCLDDADVSKNASYVEIPAGWNRYDYLWERSTGVGADDGWMSLYINGVYATGRTGLDNDTQDWDILHTGVVQIVSTARSGSFYMDTIRVDPVGAPLEDLLAAHTGTYGIAIPIIDTTNRYVTFTDPVAETLVVAECWIDPNTLTMGADEQFVFIVGDVAAYDFVAQLKYNGGYYINATVKKDVGTETTSSYAITDAFHHVRVVWAAASAPGANDGYLYLYIDGVLQEALTGIDNDTKSVGDLAFGAALSVDSGTYGIFYMDGFRWGDALTKVKFYGRIASISPSTGLFDDPAVEVEVCDWMGYLPGRELGLQAVATTKRADEALTAVMGDFVIGPPATDFDNGIETFMVVFNTDNPRTGMGSFFNKMCRNELGRCYVLGNGTLRFEHRNARAEDLTDLFALDGTMTELSISYKRRDIFNVIHARIKVMEATPTADVLLWDLKVGEYFGGEIPSIEAGDTIVFRCPFTDPALGGAVSAINVVDPITHVEFGSVADYETNDMIGDLDIDQVVGANMTVVTMENEHVANTGYLNDLQIYGRALLVYGENILEARDTVSIIESDERRFTLRLEHITDDARAQAYADHVLSQVKDSHLAPVRITVLANQEPLLMAGLIEAEVSSRFSLSESVSGIDEDFFVNNIKYVQDGQQLWVTIEAGPATRYAGVLA